MAYALSLVCAGAFFSTSAALVQETTPSLSSSPVQLSPGFNITAVISLAVSLPSHSWEYGTASQALAELYDAPYTIYGDRPFPIPTLSPVSSASSNSHPYSRALDYAKQKIVLGAPPNSLSDGDGATGDPASLGVSAILLGVLDDKYKAAAKKEVDYLLEKAPRWENGAISHRADYAELWADFTYMVPPFLAYYGAAYHNVTVLRAAVDQCILYRQILQKTNSTSSARTSSASGLWTHIIGPRNADPGLWSTGNAWAAAGMMRVLATVVKAPKELFTSSESELSTASKNLLSLSWREQAIQSLTSAIQEILDSAIRLQPTSTTNGTGVLLRNYIDDSTWFGEISGSTLLASVAYRLVSISSNSSPYYSSSFAKLSISTSTKKRYISFAESIRLVLGNTKAAQPHVTSSGTVTPAVNPLGWGDRTPYTSGSPEGQNFVVLLYAAWRDWVLDGKKV